MTTIANRLPQEEVRLASRLVGDSLYRTELSVPGIHCGGCVARIERAFDMLPGVERARVNLSTRRAAITWRSAEPPPFAETLDALGFEAYLHREVPPEVGNAARAHLVRALAVAGFAAMNIMGLSVANWSGSAPATRDLFHWISAAIALPTLAYSGRTFFVSAWVALKRGRTNMDVPIAIGVSLTFAMSLYDTITHQPHVYFDATVSLLFFLLIGRTLDHMMRERARAAVAGLERLAAYGATLVDADGTRHHIAVEDIVPGMTLALAAGDRVPVDAVVIEGRSDIDASLATGESTPITVMPGTELRAGILNLTGPLNVRAMALVGDSFLAEMVRLMEMAESGRGEYRRIADRASRIYAPAVHGAALLAFLFWMGTGADWHYALNVAVAVLIITCPCALGLAVPMVQIVAARRLFERGIMVRDGSALERLAEVDSVLFDKTGTLTLGAPLLANAAEIDPADLAVAAAIARHSGHPHSLALAAAQPDSQLHFDSISEYPGLGVEAKRGETVWRLGRADWALCDPAGQTGTTLVRNGEALAQFRFADTLRRDAAAASNELASMGLTRGIVSGDRVDAVASAAHASGIDRYHALMLPDQKVAHIEAMRAAGHRVLMVGDGLNDVPALAAAHASVAPANAADIGRHAADFVFLHQSLDAIPFAIRTARATDSLIRQNFVLAIAYNVVAVPLAFAGMLTPLLAALAMSGSSILVVANAQRLASGARSHRTAAPANDVAAAKALAQ